MGKFRKKTNIQNVNKKHPQSQLDDFWDVFSLLTQVLLGTSLSMGDEVTPTD